MTPAEWMTVFRTSPRACIRRAPWSNIHLPDLGEWTHGTWEVANAAPDSIVLQRSGSALPYFATKTVRLAAERHAWSFRMWLKTAASAPIRYLWSAHPLISVPGSFAIELPAGNLTFRTFPRDGEIRSWPMYRGRGPLP